MLRSLRRFATEPKLPNTQQERNAHVKNQSDAEAEFAYFFLDLVKEWSMPMDKTFVAFCFKRQCHQVRQLGPDVNV